MKPTLNLAKFLRKALKCACVLFPMVFFACSLNASRVVIEFKEKQSSNKSNELASNLLRVVNGSDKRMNFYLSLSLPSGWSSIKAPGVLYQVEPGDSMFIPVKLVFKGHGEGNVSYVVTANLLAESNKLQFASASWYLQIIKESDWVASVNKMESFFINNADTSSFSIHVKNSGNSAEWFSIKLAPHHQLEVFSKGQTTEVPAFFNFSLPANSDSTFEFFVKARPNEKKSYTTQNSREYNSHSGEKYPLRIMVQTQHQDQTPDRIWKSTVNFKRNSNEVKFNEFSRMVLPLTVEAHLDNMLKDATSLNLNLYGNASLRHSRALSYRFQSFFSEQYYNQRAYRGDYYYLGYFAPKTEIEVGNITGWGNFGQTPSGKGASVKQRFGRHRVGVIYVQNPDLFAKASVRTAGVRHEMELKKFNIVSYYQQSRSDFSKTSGKLLTTGGDMRFRHQHVFSTRIGASTENHFGAASPFTTNGFGGTFSYSGVVRKFNLRFTSDYGSPYYTGFQGVFNLAYGVAYKHNLKYTWSFNNSFYQQNPIYFDAQGNKFTSIPSRSERYELRLAVNNKVNNYSVRAAYYMDNLLNIRYMTRGAGFDYHPVTRSQVRFVATAFASYIKLLEFDIKDYFTAQVRTSFRYRSFTTNVRYNYGPYQAFEHIRFSQYRINHQSVFINSYYGFWIKANMISLEPSINYSYETLYKKSRFSLRPELFYFSKTGWQFSAYAEILSSSQKISRLEDINGGENMQQSSSYKDLLVGMSVKKQFGVPIPGSRFFTATVVVFKDLNGNLKQDKNEEALENVLINIKPSSVDSTLDDDLRSLMEKGEDVITNEKGIVYLRNLPRGKYLITTRSLVDNSRWFPGEPMEVLLDRSREIPIAFSRGVQLTGSISVDYSMTSARTRDAEISRIRVTAVDSAGRVYSSLTSNEGKFEMYLPVGDYRITINQNAIDDNFVLEQNFIQLTLNGNTDSYSINFHIHEKERTLKVKKFAKDGTLLQEQK